MRARFTRGTQSNSRFFTNVEVASLTGNSTLAMFSKKTQFEERTVVISMVKPMPYGGAQLFGKCIDENEHNGETINAIIFNTLLDWDDRMPASGDVWTIGGEFVTNSFDPKRLRQLKAKRLHYHKPAGKMLFYFLRYRKELQGLQIGKNRWDRIQEHFQDNPMALYEALEAGDWEQLASVKSMTPEMAARLILAWRNVDRTDIEVLAYLQDKGFDTRLGNKLLRYWGKDAVKNMEANPYYLIAFIPWKTVDAAAQMVYNIKPDDPRRLVAAVLTVLYWRLTDGKHTLTSSVELKGWVKQAIGLDDERLVEKAIALALEKGVVVGNEQNGYQTDGAARLEKRVREALQALMSPKGGQGNHGHIICTDNYISEIIARTEAALAQENHLDRFEFNEEQRAAVKMALTKPLSVICGGAGCGKTAVLRAILLAVKELRKDFYQMALAGRAAKRMEESTHEESRTIAKFLHEARRGKNDLDRYPLIVIDESSMLDLPTMDAILGAVSKGAWLLFVGDHHQLPPIQFGLVFHQLIKSEVLYANGMITELKVPKRSSGASGIADFALAIREKRVPRDLERTYQHKAIPGVSFIECDDKRQMNALVRKVYYELGDQENTQILSIRDDLNPGGVQSLNLVIQAYEDQRYYKKHGKPRKTFMPNPDDPGYRYSVGDKVMFLETDVLADLQNGSMGVVQDVGDDHLLCLFEGHTLSVAIKFDGLRKLTLAYSATTHKFQGSQARRIIIPIVRSPKLLDNAMIYTALTRGIEQVVLIGDRESYEDAVQNRSNVEARQVGLVL